MRRLAVQLLLCKEFGEPGFDSLLAPMVLVVPIAALVLAFVKQWLFNQNRNGVSHNDNEVNMNTSNITSKNDNRNINNNLTLKAAIGTVLKVAYDMTIGLSVGKLLAAPRVNAR